MIARAAAHVVGRLPAPGAAWIGRRLGDLAYVALPRRRRIALDNLRQAFPDLPPFERARLARAAARHLGLMTVELCRLLTRPLDETLATMTLDGSQHLERALAVHGRALMLTAHLGNWELLAAAHHLVGRELAIVVRPLDAGWLNALADEMRRRTGVHLIDKRGALRPVLEALRRGRLVGLLLDQNASRREGVFVPFFGRPASTSKSLALLALRTGAPILPIFIGREPDARHRVVIEPPIDAAGVPESERAVVELTARCTSAIEAAIRRTPEQWLWGHDRWRTRPAAERAMETDARA